MSDLIIGRLREGTVIDHIPAGRVLKIAKIIGLRKDYQAHVSIAMNVASKRMGKKDILKVSNKNLTKQEVDKIALLAPHATVSTIKNGAVSAKREVVLPALVENTVRCANPQCITNSRTRLDTSEPICPRFVVENEDPLELRCLYCERGMNQEKVEAYL